MDLLTCLLLRDALYKTLLLEKFLFSGGEKICYPTSMDHFEKILQRRSKILIHSLIISGTLNIALIATFVTFVLKERKEDVLSVAVEAPLKEMSLTNKAVLKGFMGMPYETLVGELLDETHVEEGQRRCDLALAFLGAFHHFDVERALSGYPVEKRELRLDDGERIILYPGIDQGRLEGIRHFSKTEVWPLTPEGLFQEIQLRKDIPKSLKEAFESTTEYFVIKRAFRRLPYNVSEDDLFSLVIDGNWQEIEALSDQIQKSSNGKISCFVSFLMPRIERGSKLSAYLLVLLEKEYALKKLDDSQMAKLLSLLTDETPEARAFLEEVKRGLRSDYLQQLAGKPLENPPRYHIVQPGDSLWKIAREYGVKVGVIKEINSLKSENLQVGEKLLLPPLLEEGIRPS